MIQCLVVDDEPLAREALISHISKMPELHLVKECENALEAMSEVRLQKIDLIFLDIEMPEISGISFLQNIKNIPGVIFTTAYREYAVEAFDLDVIDYLLKPISFERFLKSINKFYLRQAKNKNTEFSSEPTKTINVKADRKTYKIDLEHIIYFESLKDYVKIVCEKETIITYDTLSGFEEMLKNDGFVRIHRSFLVATNSIESFDSETVYLMNKELPISRTYKQSVLSKLDK